MATAANNMPAIVSINRYRHLQYNVGRDFAIDYCLYTYYCIPWKHIYIYVDGHS